MAFHAGEGRLLWRTTYQASAWDADRSRLYLLNTQGDLKLVDPLTGRHLSKVRVNFSSGGTNRPDAVGEGLVAGGALVVPLSEGVLDGFDPDTGRRLWSSSYECAGGPTSDITPDIQRLGPDQILLKCFGSHVHALDARTGKERWRVEKGAFVWSDENRILQSSYRESSCVDARGRTLWQVPGDGLGISPSGLALVRRENRVQALTPKGREAWSVGLDPDPKQFTTAQWLGPVVVLRAKDRTWAHDSESGARLWSRSGVGEPFARLCRGKALFLEETSHRLSALDPRTGAPAWTASDVAQVLDVQDARCLVQDGSGRLVDLDPATGVIRWTSGVPAEPGGSPVALKEHLVQGTDDGRLVDLDLATGTQRWSAVLQGWLEATPTLAQDAVVVPARAMITCDQFTQFPVVLDLATGRPRWSLFDWFGSTDSYLVRQGTVLADRPASEVNHEPHWDRLDLRTGKGFEMRPDGNPRGSLPALFRDTLFGSGGRGLIEAVDAASGKTLWSTELGLEGIPSCFAAGKRVLLASHDYGAWGLCLKCGAQLWHRKFDWGLSAPAFKGPVVIFSRSGQGLIALDLETGKELWTHPTGAAPPQERSGFRHDSPTPEPVIAGNWVYMALEGGRLGALDLKTGKETWSLALGSPVCGAPLIQGDWMVVTTADGLVHGLRLDPR